jgi:hypothetical protein
MLSPQSLDLDDVGLFHVTQCLGEPRHLGRMLFAEHRLTCPHPLAIIEGGTPGPQHDSLRRRRAEALLT